MARRPVFWRESYVPEQGVGQQELHSYLGLVGLTPINVRDNALERGFGLDVRQSEPLPSINLGQQENQGTVSTDGPRVSFFFKGSSAGLTRDTDRDGHQYALAPTSVCRKPGGFAGLGQPRFERAKLLRLNGGKHEPHAFGSAGVDDSCAGFKPLRTFDDANFCDRP